MNRNKEVVDYTHYEHLRFEIVNSIATSIFVIPFAPALFLLCYKDFPIVGGVLMVAFFFFAYLLYRSRPKAKPIDEYMFRKPRNYIQLDNELKNYESKVDYFHKWGYLLLAIDIIGLPICAGIVYFMYDNVYVMNVLLAIALIGAGILLSLLYLNTQKRDILRQIKTKLLS